MSLLVAGSANGTLFHATDMQSWALYIGKEYFLLANILFICEIEGDGATTPSFSIFNGSIHASSSSLEAHIATHHIGGGGGGAPMGVVSQWQTNSCLPIFYS